MVMKTTGGDHGGASKGRGAPANPEGRFESTVRESVEDGWPADREAQPSRPPTVVTIERAKTVLSRHDSPDLNFAQSVNPYRGCEHGCVYCYARPSHAYLGRKLPRQVDSSKVDIPPREASRGSALAAGFPAHRVA